MPNKNKAYYYSVRNWLMKICLKIFHLRWRRVNWVATEEGPTGGAGSASHTCVVARAVILQDRASARSIQSVPESTSTWSSYITSYSVVTCMLFMLLCWSLPCTTGVNTLLIPLEDMLFPGEISSGWRGFCQYVFLGEILAALCGGNTSLPSFYTALNEHV
jgi:hypothetical protein